MDVPSEQQGRMSATSATRELDELMACLSDFKVQSNVSAYLCALKIACNRTVCKFLCVRSGGIKRLEENSLQCLKTGLLNNLTSSTCTPF